MKKIQIEVVPHNRQRYDTVGDYFTDDYGVEQFLVSDMDNRKYEHLVIVHELVERILCFHAGISNNAIDLFDVYFELQRKTGDESEPGDDENAPYHHAHQIATVVERLLAAEIGVNWNEYENKVNSL